MYNPSMLSARVAVLTVAAVTLLAAPAGSKQDPPEVTSKPDVAVFKSTSNLVQVPVVVRDSHGHAVSGLRAEDFRLLDNGKAQIISRFTMERMESVETAADSLRNSPARTPNAAPAVSPSRFIAYVADDIGLAPEYLALGREAALRQIAAFRPPDRAAVVSTSGFVAIPFTNDRELLARTLRRINSLNRPATWLDKALVCRPMTFYWADLILAGDPKAIADCLQSAPDRSMGEAGHAPGSSLTSDAQSIVQRSERDLDNYFAVLDRLIGQMAEVPGERQIVLLSPGAYVPPRFRQSQNALVAKAIRNKVVISGVDVRGVYIPYPNGPDPTTSHSRYGIGETAERNSFMSDLSAGTGGTFLRGNNDLDLQLRRAASAPEIIYVLAFSPQTLDGKVHALKASLFRAGGYTIQARGSYLATRPAFDPNGEVRREIEEAFFSTREGSDVALQVSTDFFKEGEAATLTVTAKIDAAKLSLHQKNGRNNGEVTLVAGLFDQNGNFLSAWQKTIQLRLKDETLARWFASGITAASEFHVSPGKYVVRVVVLDAGSRRLSEHSTGVEIPW